MFHAQNLELGSFLEVLRKAKPLIELLVSLTPSTADDDGVKILYSILESPVLGGWFKSKVEADAAGVLSIESEPTPEVAQELRDRKIDWSKLIEKLPALIAIFKAFAG